MFAAGRCSDTIRLIDLFARFLRRTRKLWCDFGVFVVLCFFLLWHRAISHPLAGCLCALSVFSLHGLRGSHAYLCASRWAYTWTCTRPRRCSLDGAPARAAAWSNRRHVSWCQEGSLSCSHGWLQRANRGVVGLWNGLGDRSPPQCLVEGVVIVCFHRPCHRHHFIFVLICFSNLFLVLRGGKKRRKYAKFTAGKKCATVIQTTPTTLAAQSNAQAPRAASPGQIAISLFEPNAKCKELCGTAQADILLYRMDN